MWRAPLLPALLMFSLWAMPAQAQPSPAERIRRDMQVLVSPELEGRGHAGEGHIKARDFIVERMTELGLVPAGDDGGWLVAAPAVAQATTGPDASLKIAGRVLAPGTEYAPLGCSGGGSFSGDIVYVGYGITGPDRDDWGAIDVAGKVALVWDGAPTALEPALVGPDAHLASAEAKAATALAHGARALLILLPAGAPAPPSLAFELSGMPAAYVTADAIAEVIAQLGPDSAPRALSPAVRASGELGVSRRAVTVYNVVGRLAASPALGAPLALGAHYDHLGMGEVGSLDARSVGALHAGADDNASGVAAMLEVARQLHAAPAAWRQPVYFVAFGGEEIGLRGARRQAARWRGQPGALINLDMVGRLRGARVFAEARASQPHLTLRDVIQRGAALGLVVEEDDREHVSDAVALADVGFETLHLTTGRHADYHAPGDVLERVSVEGVAQIAALVIAVMLGMGAA
jgi:hypothetical protein